MWQIFKFYIFVQLPFKIIRIIFYYDAQKAMKAVFMFCFQSPIFWMFIEGVYLHSKISTNIFNHAPPFSLYYFIGWGKFHGNLLRKAHILSFTKIKHSHLSNSHSTHLWLADKWQTNLWAILFAAPWLQFECYFPPS